MERRLRTPRPSKSAAPIWAWHQWEGKRCGDVPNRSLLLGLFLCLCSAARNWCPQTKQEDWERLLAPAMVSAEARPLEVQMSVGRVPVVLPESLTQAEPDSSIAVVLEPVEGKRGLVARTLGLEPHTHTDTGHSNTVADSSMDTGGNSREEDKPGPLSLQSQWEHRFRSQFRYVGLLHVGLHVVLLPGPKTMTGPQRSGRQQTSRHFSPS